jgi:ABC-type glycerol-3-phosphate transport system substrate-binding protein
MKSKLYKKPWNTRMLAMALAIGLAGALNSTQAQEEGASGTNDASEQEVVLKRDPFWPVGYVPKTIKSVISTDNPEPSAAVVDNSWSEAMKKVVINGVSSQANNAYFAIINGQIKSVGDTVTIHHGGTIYTWAVDGIEPPGSVKLRRASVR